MAVVGNANIPSLTANLVFGLPRGRRRFVCAITEDPDVARRSVQNPPEVPPDTAPLVAEAFAVEIPDATKLPNVQVTTAVDISRRTRSAEKISPLHSLYLF